MTQEWRDGAVEEVRGAGDNKAGKASILCCLVLFCGYEQTKRDFSEEKLLKKTLEKLILIEIWRMT